MTPGRHIPVRLCLGCAERSPQVEMLRFVRDDQGRLRADPRRCAGGRGAYLHARTACWERFARGKGMVRSLGVAVDRPARVVFVEQCQRGMDR